VRIELVYAAAESVTGIYEIEAPATVADVLRLAAQDPRFGFLDLANAAVGIYGQSAPRSAPVADGDRVEIYRPLIQDPKTARRRRAASGAAARGKSVSKSGRS
jgi:putative ubiquitin-RnfH superfamily antitoxin RatB of RatAB toxin-antitoxin module